MTEKRCRGGGGEMFGGTQAFRSPTSGPSTAQPGGEVTIGIVTLQLILLRISVNFVLKSLDSSISLSKVHPRLFHETNCRRCSFFPLLGKTHSTLEFYVHEKRYLIKSIDHQEHL